jgi:ribosome-binding protein aMBF1 (putative translation factor)
MDLGLLQKQLADLLGGDVSTVQNWEKGRARPSKGIEGQFEDLLSSRSTDAGLGDAQSIAKALRRTQGLN